MWLTMRYKDVIPGLVSSEVEVLMATATSMMDFTFILAAPIEMAFERLCELRL